MQIIPERSTVGTDHSSERGRTDLGSVLVCLYSGEQSNTVMYNFGGVMHHLVRLPT